MNADDQCRIRSSSGFAVWQPRLPVRIHDRSLGSSFCSGQAPLHDDDEGKEAVRIRILSTHSEYAFRAQILIKAPRSCSLGL